MATITAAGSGSGIDIESLVTKLMAAESMPLSKLASKETKLQTKISAIGQFKSLISSLQSATSPLLNLSNVNGIAAKSSNTSAVTISAGNDAAAGGHSIDVYSLASTQRLISASGTFTGSKQNLASVTSGATTTAAATATLTIKFGAWTEGTPSTFAADATQSAVSIDIAAGTDGEITLADVRDAINSKSAGVSASIVNDTNGSARLVLNSTTTGAKGGFTVDLALKDSNNATLYDSTAAPTETTAFSGVVFNQTTANAASPAMDLDTVAADAHIKFDGVSVYRASNTIKDLLDDVTLTLKGTTLGTDGTTSTAANLTLSRDSGTISTQLQSFVTAYNTLASTIKSSTSYDATTKVAGTLQGDATIVGLQSQLRSMLTASYGSSSDSIRTLSQLGVAFQKDGKLALDSTKLSDAVTRDLDGVVKFLGSFDQSTVSSAPTSSYTSFGYVLNKTLGGMASTDGLIASKLEGLNKSVDILEKRYDTLVTRLTAVEKRYRAKFTAMDTAISNMQGMSSYVSQLLSSTSSSS